MKLKYCPLARRHRFCPAGTCSTCDRRRGMLTPVSREMANKSKDFYAIYYIDKDGVVRWTIPPGITDSKKYSGRYSRRVIMPASDTLLMARAALAVGLPEYNRPVAQGLPGVE